MTDVEDDEIIEEVIYRNRIVLVENHCENNFLPILDSCLPVEAASESFVRLPVSKQTTGAVVRRCRSGEELCEAHSSGSES